MKTDTLLVEVRTEELPPPAVRVLAKEFPNELLRRLRGGGFADDSATLLSESLATPRRFAALISGVRSRIESRPINRRGPQVKDCFDRDGKPSVALQGFMRTVGESDFAKLGRIENKGNEHVLWRGREPGLPLNKFLAGAVEDAMLTVPDLPLMLWSKKEDAHAFVRPVRGLVMMLGNRVISGEVMDVKSGRKTRGHPVLSKKPVQFKRAEDYVMSLSKAGVVADCEKRESELFDCLEKAPGEVRWWDNATSELKREVAAMCEKPRLYQGKIGDEFSQLPAFCVASCLIKHQKCFPLYVESHAKDTLGGFLFAADNAPKNPNNILNGVNAVVSARLRDLAFYLKADKQLTQQAADERLQEIVYHRQLGSQNMRAKRIASLAAALGEIMELSARDKNRLERATAVCKLDLPTMMVAEYPKLAGKMAALYFCGGDSEDDKAIAGIVHRHGDNNFEGDDFDAPGLPDVALFLADKLEKIVGMFLVGEKPVGRRDPHGLRRVAAQIRMILAPQGVGDIAEMSGSLAKRIKTLSLNAMLHAARSVFSDDINARNFGIGEVHEFISKRVSLPSNMDAAVMNAVYALRPDFIAEIKPRCEALQDFLRRDEAPLLIAANKRIINILRKSRPTTGSLAFSAQLLHEPAEKALYKCVSQLEKKAGQLLAQGDYQGVLSMLATDAAEPVREFFDKVMVNAEDGKLRANRLALLIRLRAQLNSVADLARLSA